jgi:RecA/RadA recombinase
MTKLHVIREYTVRDAPAVLRKIADQLEAGQVGEVNGCVVVVDAEEGLDVSYTGEGEAAPRALMLLQAGHAKLLQIAMGGKL